MSTKRLLNITPALALLFTVLLSDSASAAYYQQHQSNPAMIETLEEAHANAPGALHHIIIRGIERKGYDFERTVKRVSEVMEIDIPQIVTFSKEPKTVQARALLCFWA